MSKLYPCLMTIFASLCYVFSTSYGAQTDKVVSTDVWFVEMESQLTKKCDDLENSPFCFVESQEICEQFMPVAVEACKYKHRDEMPDRVTKSERYEWSRKLGRCIVEELFVAAGSEKVDIENRCK